MVGNSPTKGIVMKNVFICSPYRSDDASVKEANIQRAKQACLEAVKNNCIPFAPHLYFPNFLRDNVEDERQAGIQLGLIWLSTCDELWIIGTEITEGMQIEIDKATELGLPVEERV